MSLLTEESIKAVYGWSEDTIQGSLDNLSTTIDTLKGRLEDKHGTLSRGGRHNIEKDLRECMFNRSLLEGYYRDVLHKKYMRTKKEFLDAVREYREDRAGTHKDVASSGQTRRRDRSV